MGGMVGGAGRVKGQRETAVFNAARAGATIPSGLPNRFVWPCLVLAGVVPITGTKRMRRGRTRPPCRPRKTGLLPLGPRRRMRAAPTYHQGTVSRKLGERPIIIIQDATQRRSDKRP